MKYSVENLKTAYNNNQKLKYLFFWGHTPNKDRGIGKSCLSQWWQSSFIVRGIEYKTAEHWMMAEKAKLFNDGIILKEIIESSHPMEVKKLGRKVKNFDPVVWDQHKYEIVKQGNLHKFSQSKELKEFLLNTRERILVEASPVDSIWGIGMDANDEKVLNPNFWNGQNLLGLVLMEVRDELRNKNEN